MRLSIELSASGFQPATDYRYTLNSNVPGGSGFIELIEPGSVHCTARTLLLLTM